MPRGRTSTLITLQVEGANTALVSGFAAATVGPGAVATVGSEGYAVVEAGSGEVFFNDNAEGFLRESSASSGPDMRQP